MKVFRNLILIAFSTLASSAFAAEQVEGSYNGMTFTATIDQKVAAVIDWHDNGQKCVSSPTERRILGRVAFATFMELPLGA